jgi:hypothetical protein
MIPSISDIPIGRENAISRADLASLWGVGDREMRKQIAQFRAEYVGTDYAILSSSHEDGYWRSNDSKELDEFIRETSARARSVFVSLRMARRVQTNAGQMRMVI